MGWSKAIVLSKSVNKGIASVEKVLARRFRKGFSVGKGLEDLE